MKRFITFEHQRLRIGDRQGKEVFSKEDWQCLAEFYGEEGVPYFNLINQGVKFTAFVGVLQIGKLVIEVLPKADKREGEAYWRHVLIEMLRAVGAFNIDAPSYASLQVKHNFILDLYLELFVNEVESLLHKGLVKKYYKIEQNSLALKGSLQFHKQIQKNLVHKERFYVRHSTYDKEHLLHQILYKTIQLIRRINSNQGLNSRIGRLLLDFPEMKTIKVTEATFERLSFNRKTEIYKPAIEIARLLLLNYHPDLKGGANNVLALMFNMNNLWEAFVYRSLLANLPSSKWSGEAQVYKNFWKRIGGSSVGMQPDIVLTKKINEKEELNYVLDTKWKNIADGNPSSADLRQLYVYHVLYKAVQVALVYPGEDPVSRGRYFCANEKLSNMECSIIRIPQPVANNEEQISITTWQKQIADLIFKSWIIEA